MKRLLLALFLLSAPAILGAPHALTNTRYGEVPGSGILTTNGRDAFVLWGTRLTRVVEGEYRVGRPVFSEGTDSNIVWTGTHFLAVIQTGSDIVGRMIDGEGEPVGGEFTIIQNGVSPRMASNGRNVLLVYQRGSSVLATLLTAAGAPVNGGSVTLATNASYDVASNGSGFAAITASQSLVRVTTITARGTIATEATVSSFDLGEAVERPVAIASDGAGYLGVWSTRALFDAIPVAADGTLGRAFQLGRLQEGEFVRRASVAWTGSGYAAAFVGGPHQQNRLYAVRATAHAVQSVSEGLLASSSTPVSLVQAGGRTLMTWHDGAATSLLLGDLSDLDDSVPVTFAAAEQVLGAAVSSQTATLFAWTETIDGTSSLRMGVRGADGSWAERRIGTGGDLAYAAGTDGTEFLLITVDGVGWSAVRIDAQANVLSRSPRIPMDVSGGGFTVVSNGKGYAVSYINGDGRPALARVSRTGVVSPPQFFPFRDYAENAIVATDGNNFLYVWNDVEQCLWPWCVAQVRLVAVRLGPDFTPIDTHVLEDRAGYVFASTWRNGKYEVYWATEKGIVIQYVPASGPVDLTRRSRIPETENLYQRWSRLHVTHGSAWTAIWNESGSEATRYFDFQWRAIPTPFEHERSLLATPDGRLAWVTHQTQPAAPHHGALRLMLDVPDTPAAVPDAPHATLRNDGREITIEWTPPAQAVDGYRVEYRIGNGSWNEFPRQYGANERSVIWTSITRGKSYAFRVRAFTEAGPGEYSEPVRATAGTSRRRSVR